MTHLNQDAVDLADDARRLLLELDREVPGAGALTAECRPATDVVDGRQEVQVLVDIPGVPANAIRIVVRRSTLLVVGAKFPPGTRTDTRFHLAERSYGHFARVVRLPGAIDAARARATLGAGELHIVIPRIDDRRGALVEIPVTPR